MGEILQSNWESFPRFSARNIYEVNLLRISERVSPELIGEILQIIWNYLCGISGINSPEFQEEIFGRNPEEFQKQIFQNFLKLFSGVSERNSPEFL